MRHDDRPTLDEAVDGFDIDDLFMSRTDKRGVIQSANGVFRRLAGYDWGDIVGAPHRLIRHPDMPKAAFRLMWTMLQKGQPFAAYVKNRAASGKHYWVFAVVVPVQGGYLSVRLKPSTDLLDIVGQLYGDLRLREREERADPEAGIKMLEARLNKLGFNNYGDFISHSLSREYSSRRDAMGVPPDPGVEAFTRISRAVSEIHNDIGKVKHLFHGMATTPVNLSIQGSRISGGASALMVIAKNYVSLADQLRQTIESIGERLETLHVRAQDMGLGFFAQSLFDEAIQIFAAEKDFMPGADRQAEMAILAKAMDGFVEQVRAGCRDLNKEVRRMAVELARLKRLISGLALTRIMCQIECAGLGTDTRGIESMADHLSTFQSEVSSLLDRLMQGCEALPGMVSSAEAILLGSNASVHAEE